MDAIYREKVTVLQPDHNESAKSGNASRPRKTSRMTPRRKAQKVNRGALCGSWSIANVDVRATHLDGSINSHIF